ncbi:hypothetical protein OQA88_11631 [Cercophora sp. LCS_1]
MSSTGLSEPSIGAVVRELHSDLIRKHRKHGASVDAFWRSFDKSQRVRCMKAGAADGLVLKYPTDCSLGVVCNVLPEWNLRDIADADSSALLDILKFRTSHTLFEQYSMGFNHGPGDHKVIEDSMRTKDLRHTDGFEDCWTLFLDGEHYGSSFEVLEKESLAGFSLLIERGACIPQSIGELVLQRQSYLLQGLVIIIDDILEEGAKAGKKEQTIQPSTNNLGTPLATTIGACETPRKLPLPKLVVMAEDQRAKLQEKLELQSTEPTALANNVRIYFFGRPELVPDEKGHIIPVHTDRYISAAVFEAVHNAVRASAIWHYISRLLAVLQSTSNKAYQSILLQELCNVCHLEYGRARAHFKHQVRTGLGLQRFKRVPNIDNEAGSTRVVIKGNPEDLARTDPQLYYILRLCEPEATAAEAVDWVVKLDDLHNSHPSECERLAKGVLEGFGDLAAIVSFIYASSETLSMPSPSRNEGQMFVAGSQDLDVELGELKKKIDVLDFAAPIDNLLAPGVARAALKALDDFVIENAGSKLGFIYQDLIADCLLALEHQNELATANLAKIKAPVLPVVFQEQTEARVKRRRDKKTRPSDTSIFEIAPHPGTKTAELVEEEAPSRPFDVVPSTALALPILLATSGASISTSPVGINSEDMAIQLRRMANQAASLSHNYQQASRFEDLQDAIAIMERVVDIGGGSVRPYMLSNLGTMLTLRFERTSSIYDLDRAVHFCGMAADATPRGDPDRALCWNSLGSALHKRFGQTGSINDVNRAIDAGGMAVDAVSQDDPSRAGYSSNLGSAFSSRFDLTGSTDDLNLAILFTGKAVEDTPQGDPDLAGFLNSLGIALHARFGLAGSMDDLARAVDVAGLAVNATPQDHPSRAIYLNNFGNRLYARFEKTGSTNDLDRAISATKMAFDLAAENSPYRAAIATNLGVRLTARFKQAGLMDDLNRAVEITTTAVELMPRDHPGRAACLGNLGSVLIDRFVQVESTDDFQHFLSSFEEAWSCHFSPPSLRIQLARRAAGVLASLQRWDESSNLLQQAVELLPKLSSRSLTNTDKQRSLAEFAGLASDAAATALNAGKEASHALQLLELGRGIVAGLLMDMRGDVSGLKQKHPSLAEQFTALRDELDSPMGLPTPASPGHETSLWRLQLSRRQEADRKFSELITNIRAQPGFDCFLRQLDPDELMAAANLGPISVVNLSEHRCDAFLVERDRIRVLELPLLQIEEVRKWVKHRVTGSLHVAPLLRRLWDTIAHPILDALGFRDQVSDENWPHVWWIPTGLLSQLPLHAAGRHALHSTETVLDRVMSSYAPSIKSLLHGRRHPVQNSNGPSSGDALLVAMRETPGLPENKVLPFAADEVAMLKTLCPSLQLRPIIPVLRKSNVLQHLPTCKIFHFAGHGQSDLAEPSRSRLLLEDWETNPLTAGDIREHRFQENAPFLGYLSACSTAANEAAQLVDEGIHLVSAFQLAGFRHLVGTLWEVSDKHCVDVARVLYETLRDEGMTDAAVCRGLHRAIRSLRDGGCKNRDARGATLMLSGAPMRGMADLYWVPYIHVGV